MHIIRNTSPHARRHLKHRSAQGDAAKLLEERDFPVHEELYQKIFELGRRYKILNPERMRDTYGKMIYFLQDSVRGERQAIGLFPLPF